MKTLLVLPLLILLAPVSSTVACLNTPPTHTSLDGGSVHGYGGYDASRLRQRMKMSPAEIRFYETVKSPATPSTPSKQLETRALDLIFSGDYAGALPLLQKAEATGPGDYSIAANLGTTYELVGDNASALTWIREAVHRNPGSHQGTEWVHVLILEAKLRDAQVPGSGLRDSLVAVPARLEAATPLVAGGVLRSAETVREAISYQLQERVLFVKPKDPYVADLLFSLAVLNANLSGVEGAGELLPLAAEYGYPHADRLAALQKMIARALWVANAWSVARWALGLATLGALLRLAYRRKWFFLTPSARAAYLATRQVH